MLSRRLLPPDAPRRPTSSRRRVSAARFKIASAPLGISGASPRILQIIAVEETGSGEKCRGRKSYAERDPESGPRHPAGSQGPHGQGPDRIGTPYPRRSIRLTKQQRRDVWHGSHSHRLARRVAGDPPATPRSRWKKPAPTPPTKNHGSKVEVRRSFRFKKEGCPYPQWLSNCFSEPDANRYRHACVGSPSFPSNARSGPPIKTSR